MRRPSSSSIGWIAALWLLAAAPAALAQPAAQCVEPAAAAAPVDPRADAAAALAAGNAALQSGAPSVALARFRDSERLARASGDAAAAVFAAANAARAAVAAGELDGVEASLAAVLAQPDALAAGDGQVRLRIHVARSLADLADAVTHERARAARLRAAALLAEAAQQTRDARLRSYAFGYRGALYERAGLLDDARVLSRQALLEAERAAAPEARYRWLWQLGRIERRAGDADGSLAAYRGAVATLAVLRADLALGSADAAFAFRGEVEPAYRELVDLLLQRAWETDGAARQALLAEARDTLEGLKAAEISDHFHDACLSAQQQVAPERVPGAAVLYPVLLPDRVELIVGTDAGLSLQRAPIDGPTLEAEVRELRRLLEKRTTRQFLPVAERLYDALIRPIAATLASSQIEVLVVVPGGALRTIPFAALYDGQRQQYLIQQWAVAVSPGLTLTDPRSIPPGGLPGLIAGISESLQGYPALDYVPGELAQVSEAFPGVVLLDASFRIDRFESEVASRPVGIVHIASHGEFRPEASESFLLAHDGKLSMDRFARTVGRTRLRSEQPLELIVLSACQTAAGDDRAALGLAGVALQSGARSALATLWSVNDEATAQIVARFYRELAGGASRARALQIAQLAMLEQRALRHPIYWAPFLLISSWL